jgi:hypothetical protein
MQSGAGSSTGASRASTAGERDMNLVLACAAAAHSESD